MLGRMGPGSSLAIARRRRAWTRLWLGARDDNGRNPGLRSCSVGLRFGFTCQTANSTNEIGPCLWSGAGVCPSFVLFFRSPGIEGGWRVEKTPRLPGSAGLVIQLCPDRSELTHPSQDVPAPLGAPYAASSAISL